MTQPKLITKPFAGDALPGYVNEIPKENPAGAPEQNASWSEGFPPITMTDINDGGLPPNGEDMNGVLRAITEHNLFIGGGGVYKFTSEYVAEVGGYSKGAVLVSDDKTALWMSIQDNNTQNFNGATKTQWRRIAFTELDSTLASIQSALNTKADKSVTIIAGDGLTGGGTLAGNRVLAVDNSVVRTDRTITAGTGLSGGGNLSANRTLSVNYGTTAGTAAQGNDARITGAAQKSANLSDLANAGAARQNLGLGTAATKNAGTLAGNLMPVGSFSLGSTNANSYTASGTTELFTYNPSYLPTTAPSGYGTGIKIGHSYAGTAAEILIPHNEPAILARGRQDRPFIKAVLTTENQTIGGKKKFTEDVAVSGVNVGIGGGAVASNVSLGSLALSSNTTGRQNLAVGAHALRVNKTGVSCTSVGAYSLTDSLGSRNTAIGDAAGTGIVNSSKSTALGASTLTTGDYSGATAIGVDANVTGNNQIQLGAANTTTFAYGAVQARSDKRDKTEIRDTSLGLDFVLRLRPVDYKWDMRDFYRPEAPSIDEYETEEEFNVANKQWLDAVKLSNITPDGSKKRHRYHHGFIAQEVQSLISETGVDFGGFQDHSKIGGDDVLSIGYEEFIAPLIKSVQELSARVKELEIKVEHEGLGDDHS